MFNSIRARTSRIPLVLIGIIAVIASPAKPIRLLNVSYDPTRELFRDYNDLFARAWKKRTGQVVIVNQSHGGSGKQARSILDGLEADVATLALAYDIDNLHRRGNLLPADWAARLPNQSLPWRSTIVFLVRKGNPLAIRDWPDLIGNGVKVITANPKTSGGARWVYLAAYGQHLMRHPGDAAGAENFVRELYRGCPVLDAATRGSTTTFAQRGIGDVCLGWENEAHMALRKMPLAGLEIVTPPLSIAAEPPVAVVAAYAKAHGTVELAHAYLEGLYQPEAQALAAKNFYRPLDSTVAGQFRGTFPSLEFFSLEEVFGNWEKAHAAHFAEGGSFDRIFRRKP